MSNKLSVITKDVMNKLASISPVSTPEAIRAVHVMVSLFKTPQLAKCTPRSLLLAAFNVAKLGLNPDPQLGHVYIVPFGTEATVIIGYKGFLELARRSERVTVAKADLIYSGDLFEYEETASGTAFRHSPAWILGHDRGELVGGYALIQFTDGTRQIHVVPKFEIDKAQKRSRASSRGPWVDDKEAMQRKTVIRRAAAFWPLSAELSKAVDLDMRADEGKPQGDERDFEDVLDVDAEAIEPGTHTFGKDRDEQAEEQTATGV